MTTQIANTTVLVTGGSGFLGAYCILNLLQAGYRVRTTVRSLKREDEVRAMLKAADMEAGDQLSFVAADLLADQGWVEAVAGCEYVLHVASPFPAIMPKNEQELITPAKEGTLRVLRAARNAGVKRVVLTSSFAAVGYGHAATTDIFTEEDWTDLKASGLSAYVKSKTLAEQAAWEFIRTQGDPLELAVINPVGIFGPLLGADFSASVQLINQLLAGQIKACPQVYFNVVDVRDVAHLHVLAMTSPQAKGERFLALAGPCLSMHELALLLREKLGDTARKVPTKELPNWLVHLVALFNPALQGVLPELGKIKTVSNQKAKSQLGWSPRSNEEAILATANSLLHLSLRNTQTNQ
ncbi:SDR family oxidoreductase [Spirosoma koreense]